MVPEHAMAMTMAMVMAISMIWGLPCVYCSCSGTKSGLAMLLPHALLLEFAKAGHDDGYVLPY